MTTTVQTSDNNQTACLLPIFLSLGADLTGINVRLEDALGKVNRAISAAEELDPSYPALPALRAKRRELLRFQTELLKTEQHFQDEAVALEDGYAATTKIEGLDWLFKKN